MTSTSGFYLVSFYEVFFFVNIQDKLSLIKKEGGVKKVHRKKIMSTLFVIPVLASIVISNLAHAKSLRENHVIDAFTLMLNAPKPALQEIPLVKAPVIRSATVTVGNATYSIPLAPRDGFSFTPLATGILWTPVRYDPTGSMQTQPLYFTPYAALQKKQSSASFDLWASAHLLTTLPFGTDKAGRNYLPVNLYRAKDYAVFSQSQLLTNGKTLVTFYVQQPSGQPIIIYRGKKTEQQQFYVYTQNTDVLILSEQSSPFGHIVTGANMNVSTGVKTRIPPTPGPVIVTHNLNSLTLHAGMMVYAFDQQGHMTASYSEPNVSMQQQLAQMKGNLLPVPFLLSANASSLLPSKTVLFFQRTQQNSTMVLNNARNPSPITTVTIDKNRLAQNSKEKPIHIFSLESQEGPMVTWRMQMAHHHPVWTAEFTAKGWKYNVGPFANPAASTQTTFLSLLLNHATQTVPVPTMPSGTCSIALSKADPSVPVQTIMAFPLSNDRWVRFQGSGLNPFSDITAWTLIQSK